MTPEVVATMARRLVATKAPCPKPTSGGRTAKQHLKSHKGHELTKSACETTLLKEESRSPKFLSGNAELLKAILTRICSLKRNS